MRGGGGGDNRLYGLYRHVGPQRVWFFSRFWSQIDPMQKWLPSNYSFVRIQNSLTNLVRENKFFTIFVSKRG